MEEQAVEIIAECGVDLFAEELPSMDELRQLANFVNCSEHEFIKFGKRVEENMSKTDAKASLASGIGLYISGRAAEAVEKLSKAADCEQKYTYLGFSLRRTGQFDEAIANLQKSLDYGADSLTVTLEKAATYRQAGNSEAMAKELGGCANFENVSAEYHYQLGRYQETQGSYEDAMDNYAKAIELVPGHQRALFHLAYRCDLSGDEDAAIDYYKQIARINPVYISALMNLAVLYEDRSEYGKASKCVGKVLMAHPNHKKATMFRKDIDSSMTMVYDEEKEKKKDRQNKILEMPISDFELSVRSRNCLKKMKIFTLGDLLHITEAELLSYKNFGETSLKEIKALLDPRSLVLGMAMEEQEAGVIPEEIVIEGEDVGLLGKPIEDLQLSVRPRHCLKNLNIRTLGEIVSKTEAELLAVKNFGVTSLNEIKKALGNLGLSLRHLE